MKYLVILALFIPGLVSAQEQPNQQVVIQQIDLRRQEEMTRAITCEASKPALQAKLDAALKEIEALKKEKK